MVRYHGPGVYAADRVFDKVTIDCFASEDP